MTDLFKFGDQLVLTVGNQHVRAKVVLASQNGRSLLVQFDGAISTNGGYCVGSMPLVLEDDVWRSVVDSSTVNLTREQ